MPIKIVVTIAKGGTGKTVTSINLGAGLALEGFRTLVVDTDTQGQVAKILLEDPPPYGLADLFAGGRGIHPARDRLDILAGGSALTRITAEITARQIGREYVLSDALDKIDQDYDFVVLDTSPARDILRINALFYADTILAPVTLDRQSLEGLAETVRDIKDVQRFRPALNIGYILPAICDMRERISADYLSQLIKAFGPLVCDPVKRSVQIKRSTSYCKTIWEYCPYIDAALAYQTLVKRIINHGKN